MLMQKGKCGAECGPMTRRTEPRRFARPGWLETLRLAVLTAAFLFVLFPITWVALASFKTPEQMSEPFLIAFSPSLTNWRNVLDSGVFAAAGRSAVVGIVTVAISLVVGSMGA